MKRFVYADNAATTRMSDKAIEVMTQYMREDYANPSQPYSFSRKAKRTLREAREMIANSIGASSPEQIIFTSGGSESDNMVIKSMRGNRIITSPIEHHAILNSCEKEHTSFVDVNSDGLVSANSLAEIINPDTKLVSIMMANNEIGTIQPIKGLAEIAHSHNCLFHTDAVQAVGHIDINVDNLGVDFLSASAHKFNGPKGIGFLYVKDRHNLTSLINGGSQEFGLRAGTENVAAIAAMAIALEEGCKETENNTILLKSLKAIILSALDNAGIEYKCNGTNQLPGILSLSFKCFSGESLLHRLDLRGICVSTGSACDSKNTQISHVLKAIKLNEDYAKGTIRISLGRFNNSDEAKYLAESLISILK